MFHFAMIPPSLILQVLRIFIVPHVFVTIILDSLLSIIIILNKRLLCHQCGRSVSSIPGISPRCLAAGLANWRALRKQSKPGHECSIFGILPPAGDFSRPTVSTNCCVVCRGDILSGSWRIFEFPLLPSFLGLTSPILPVLKGSCNGPLATIVEDLCPISGCKPVLFSSGSHPQVVADSVCICFAITDLHFLTVHHLPSVLDTPYSRSALAWASNTLKKARPRTPSLTYP